MKQKKLIFNFFVNRNCKKLTDSRKRAKILADNRKSHHPIETLIYDQGLLVPGPSENTNIVYTGVFKSILAIFHDFNNL